MSHGTGHHGSVANVMEGRSEEIPLKDAAFCFFAGPQAQVEKEKQRVVLAPGLPGAKREIPLLRLSGAWAGTPEGDWMEVHDLIQDRGPSVLRFPQSPTWRPDESSA